MARIKKKKDKLYGPVSVLIGLILGVSILSLIMSMK